MLAVLNMVALALKDLRFMIVVLSITILSWCVVVLTGDPYINSGAIIASSLVLMAATVRMIIRSFDPVWFLNSQRTGLSSILRSTLYTSLTTVPTEELASGQKDVGDPIVAGNVMNSIALSALSSRVIYLWAYRLQQYRESHLSVLFTIIPLCALIVLSVIAFTEINMGLYNIQPMQFEHDEIGDPSPLAMMVFSFAGLFVGEAGGIRADGDGAYLVQIVSAFYGAVLLAVVLLSVGLTVARSREDLGLRETVRDLKTRAREEDERLRSQVSVGVEDAIRYLEEFEQAFVGLIRYVTQLIPPDFLADDVGGRASLGDSRIAQ